MESGPKEFPADAGLNYQALEVLLVEDDPDDVELTLHTLREARITNPIKIARDGEEALDYIFCRGPYAGSNAPLLRLILLDLKLPKVDGLEVLRQIKKDPRANRVPVVILTSSKEERDLVTGYQLGANSYIQKPVDFEQFQNTVRETGFYWLVVNQPLPPGAPDDLKSDS
jgi:CheY-like chemotaxis protein